MGEQSHHGAPTGETPEEVTPPFAAVFCLHSAPKRDMSEHGGVSWAENHSVGAEGRFPKLPSLLTFFWLKEAPGQKWPKTGTNCLNVARRRRSLPRPTVLSSPHFLVLTWRLEDH